MSKLQIPTDSELNALVSYDESFRFFLSKDNLEEYDKGFVNWHKQPSIEISIVYEGAVSANVLEHEEIVSAGDGFFIMPNFLHSIRPARGFKNAKYYTLIFYPEILYGERGSYYDIAYYQPMENCNSPLFTFSHHFTWTEEIMNKFKWIADNYSESDPEYRLKVQHILQDAWVLFTKHLINNAKPNISAYDSRKIMLFIQYLQEHYQEKFSLDALSTHMSMSRNECCRYFKKMMNMTISDYLLEYRLSKATTLLTSSGHNITEIAGLAGFCDSSFFIKMFKEKFGITPNTYRKNYKN